MNYSIVDIEGIGATYAKKLAKIGIKTTGALLKAGGGRKGRKEIADKSGISDKLILNWVNKADLMRISGIGPQFSELLEAAGVDTVKELRNRNADNLAAKMAEVNDKKHLCKSTPSAGQVGRWVASAKTMAPAVTY